jgi:hypothetical protein
VEAVSKSRWSVGEESRVVPLQLVQLAVPLSERAGVEPIHQELGARMMTF